MLWSSCLVVASGLSISIVSSAFSAGDAKSGLSNLLANRAVSPDNTCGDVSAGSNNGYSCDVTVNYGGCCSQNGYCGSSADYCGLGCQSAFGTCNASLVENTYTCGEANGDISCTNDLCCSQAGYCGTTTDYCDSGCQSAYGVCTSSSTSPSGGSGGLCGPKNGNSICSDNQCCSASGYCGSTEGYCMDPVTCLLEYGRCDSDATPAGTSTANDPRPLLGSVTYTDDIYDCIEDNVVALSYDDGPYLYTSQLLDILNETGFQATFFITGNNNGKGEIDITAPYPSLIQRMIAEGHQVASHTWSHYSLQNITSDLRKQQMIKNEMAFNNIIGKYPTYMRPPYSQCDEASGCQADLLALGYHRVYFDLDTQDYLNPLPSQIQNSKKIVEAALQAPGVTDYLSIQHDIIQQSVSNLTSYYYAQIKAKGWRGVTVGECLRMQYFTLRGVRRIHQKFHNSVNNTKVEMPRDVLRNSLKKGFLRCGFAGFKDIPIILAANSMLSQRILKKIGTESQPVPVLLLSINEGTPPTVSMKEGRFVHGFLRFRRADYC